MKESKFLIIADYTQETHLTLTELCEACHISTEDVTDLIEYSIIHHPHPHHTQPDTWVFDLEELKRVQTTLRLKRQLGVNYAGAALVLDLLEELKDLRDEVALMRKHHL